MVDTKLGGGVATANTLRNVTPTSTGSEKSTASILVAGINDIIQSVSTYKIREAYKTNEEDRIRAVAHAETEHIDTTNAMQGGSYDSKLNDEVSGWRSSGLNESEIRLKIKEYKFSKSVTDLGLDKGSEADDASKAYFETYNNLEMKALTPLITQDRKEMQDKITNINYSYIKNSTDDVNTKLANIIQANKAYGMGEPEAVNVLFQSAFDLARNGDESQLRSLKEAKNSDGIGLLDTVEGSKAYSEFSDNLMKKKEHDADKAEEARKKTQEVNATNIYTAMIGSNDIHAFKMSMDKSLKNGEITMSQHNSLDGYYKAITKKADGEGKAKTDRSVYVDLMAKAIKGTLPMPELLKNSALLENADFERIAGSALTNGGINGVGTEESKRTDEAIENDAKAYSGISSINDIGLSLTDKQIFSKKYSYIKYNLSKAVDTYTETHGQLPSQEERNKMRDEVVRNSKEVITATVPKKEAVVKTKEDKPTKSDKNNGVQELLNKRNTFNTKEEHDAWFRSLTEAEKNLIKGK